MFDYQPERGRVPCRGQEGDLDGANELCHRQPDMRSGWGGSEGREGTLTARMSLSMRTNLRARRKSLLAPCIAAAITTSKGKLPAQADGEKGTQAGAQGGGWQ